MLIELECREYHEPIKVPAGSHVKGVEVYNEELDTYFFPEVFGSIEIIGSTEEVTTFENIEFHDFNFDIEGSVSYQRCIFHQMPNAPFISVGLKEGQDG